MTDPDQLLHISPVVGVAEAARIARVSPQTIERWIERGWLPNHGTAERPFISPDDIPVIAVAPRAEHARPSNGVEQALTPTAIGRHITMTSQEDLAQILLLIRDAWLTPYIDQIAKLSQTVGRLEAEQTFVEERSSQPAQTQEQLTIQIEAIVAGLTQSGQAQAAEQSEQLASLAEEIATLQRDGVPGGAEVEALKQEIVDLRRLVSVAWTAIEQRVREDEAERARRRRRWWQR
jgi:hypothetical protein